VRGEILKLAETFMERAPWREVPQIGGLSYGQRTLSLLVVPLPTENLPRRLRVS